MRTRPRIGLLAAGFAAALIASETADAGWRRRVAHTSAPAYMACARPGAKVYTTPAPTSTGPTAWWSPTGDVVRSPGRYNMIAAPVGTSAPPLPVLYDEPTRNVVPAPRQRGLSQRRADVYPGN